MVELQSNLTKGFGNGKKAAILAITSGVSFNKSGIKNLGIKTYRDYLLQFVGYDEVYIIASSVKEKKINEEYFDRRSIVFGIDEVDLFNRLGIEDVFCRQHALIFFGGVLSDYYFSMVNRIYEWYVKRGNGHFYTLQDDPDFITINPLHFVEKRLPVAPMSKKPYIYDETTSDAKLYFKYQKNSDFYNCFDNTIVAYCGNNYPLFFSRVLKEKNSTQNAVSEPKYWCKFPIYCWQAVNCNLDEKLKDYPFERKYRAEYHGYSKHNKYRLEKTLEFYNALEGTNKIIEATRQFSDKFEHAEHFSEIPYNSLFKEICQAYASFVIANPSTFDDFISPRYFDLMLSDIIAFVFTPYDSKKAYTDDDELKSFMYVDDPNDFKERVEKVATDESFFRRIKHLQRKSVYDKFGIYMSDESKQKFIERLKLSG